MKNTELLKALVDDIAKYGEREIQVDLLTENQSNLIEITGLNSWKNEVTIDCDINDLKEFKKRLK